MASVDLPQIQEQEQEPAQETSALPVHCDGCGILFPLREAAGDCPKCVKLLAYDIGTPDYAQHQKWQQCLQCGVTRRNMPLAQPGETQTCGSIACNEKAAANRGSQGHGPLGSSSTANQTHSAQRQVGHPTPINEQTQLRVQAVRDRIAGRQQVYQASATDIGTTNTTRSLLHHEHGGGEPGDAKIFIGWQARSNFNGKIDGDLGGQFKKYAMSRFMPDIKAEIVETINIEWVKSGKKKLLPDDVSFRWSGNRTLDPNTATLTALDFHNHYNTPSESNAALKIDQIPTFFKSVVKKQKGPMVFFDMYIDWKAWNSRVNPVEAKKKRGRNNSLASIASSKASKQPRKLSSGTQAMVSLFNPNARSSSTGTRPKVQTVDNVTLRKLICIADVVAGSSDILDVDTTLTGLLKSKPFAHGAMKVAFDLHLSDGTQLVAKRFFRATSDHDQAMTDDSDAIEQVTVIDPQEQKEAIENEAHRLAEGVWFLKEFYTHCSMKEVSVDKNIQFSSAFIGKEIGSTRSTASGCREHASDLDELPDAHWLIEPKRPSTVTKFSGTLNHQIHRKDLQSLTLSAFAHFVYLKSKKSRVFADIQGTATNIKGKDIMVLFDLMTHSPTCDTGIGDFGPEGIASFVNDHICHYICKELSLNKLVAHSDKGNEDGFDDGQAGEDSEDENGSDGSDD
ncbi:hypothetical protein GALMADRAFT_138162 [Galerina marginata CBS 339.88]|uniref:Alpha-type protein kinase domain-containing protein n=1 Tax=Galerina marginata (strain CBS 339.88) TaxID=685588 RepID=A0A067TDP5_GALM3|nr:hypothetical protein GALMADRAFT_138162 [Galerina marginata CBS 339.88]